jgi:hypothetical protein
MRTIQTAHEKMQPDHPYRHFALLAHRTICGLTLKKIRLWDDRPMCTVYAPWLR